MSATRIVSIFAACLILPLLAAFGADGLVLAVSGRSPEFGCLVLPPVTSVATALGLFVSAVAFIALVVSAFKDQKALGLTIGGVLLSLLPVLVQSGFGVQCLPP